MNFVTNFGPSIREPQPLYWVHRTTLPPGMTLRIAVLNTALLSQDNDDKGRLVNSLPIQAILIPKVTGEQHTRLRPATVGEALRALVPSTIKIMALPNGLAQSIMRAFAHLVRQVPCHHCHPLSTPFPTLRDCRRPASRSSPRRGSVCASSAGYRNKGNREAVSSGVPAFLTISSLQSLSRPPVRQEGRADPVCHRHSQPAASAAVSSAIRRSMQRRA